MQVRASFVRDFLLEASLDPRGTEILARLGDDVAARIREDTPVAFVDAADFEALLDAAFDVVGGEGVQAIGCRHLVRFRDNPILKTMIDAVVRVFGLSPQLLLKGVPRSRPSVLKDAGDVVWLRLDDNACRMQLRGFRPRNTRAAHANIAGAWLGAVHLCGKQGSVVVEPVGNDGDADFIVRWR
ncbi:MAG TPA: hypothetical protein VGF99_01105 [Myxococcota bacterium]